MDLQYQRPADSLFSRRKRHTGTGRDALQDPYDRPGLLLQRRRMEFSGCTAPRSVRTQPCLPGRDRNGVLCPVDGAPRKTNDGARPGRDNPADTAAMVRRRLRRAVAAARTVAPPAQPGTGPDSGCQAVEPSAVSELDLNRRK